VTQAQFTDRVMINYVAILLPTGIADSLWILRFGRGISSKIYGCRLPLRCNNRLKRVYMLSPYSCLDGAVDVVMYFVGW
jgi:hypothetical protein